ncbi:hypothetical protein ACLOJK_021673 [Asimina triloba]
MKSRISFQLLLLLIALSFLSRNPCAGVRHLMDTGTGTAPVVPNKIPQNLPPLTTIIPPLPAIPPIPTIIPPLPAFPRIPTIIPPLPTIPPIPTIIPPLPSILPIPTIIPPLPSIPSIPWIPIVPAGAPTYP